MPCPGEKKTSNKGGRSSKRENSSLAGEAHMGPPAHLIRTSVLGRAFLHVASSVHFVPIQFKSAITIQDI